MFDLTHSTKDSDKKIQKKWQANILFGSAVIWAEMAADHENGKNSKKKFFLRSWPLCSLLIANTKIFVSPPK